MKSGKNVDNILKTNTLLQKKRLLVKHSKKIKIFGKMAY